MNKFYCIYFLKIDNLNLNKWRSAGPRLAIECHLAGGMAPELAPNIIFSQMLGKMRPSGPSVGGDKSFSGSLTHTVWLHTRVCESSSTSSIGQAKQIKEKKGKKKHRPIVAAAR
jgi:hypothetical protein